MDQESAATAAAESTMGMGPITTVHLILVVLLALGVIVVVYVAAKLRARARQQRKEAESASERLAEVNEVDPPTAPEPPPLAPETPVVAAAPLDAAPATLAGDMEPPREASTGEAEVAPPADGPTGDDLTRMKGVGPKLAAQLQALGYPRYADLAALDPAARDALDAELGVFSGRLARDRVVEQAGFLARGDTAGFEAAFGKL